MVEISQATLFDVAETGGGKGWATWRLMRDMWMRGQAFAFHADGQLLATAGLYPMKPELAETLVGYPLLLKALRPSEVGAAEVWFSPGPSAGRQMLGIVRHARLTLRAAPYRRIVCNCTSHEGVRFARLSGLRFAARHELGELWECPVS